MATNGMNVSEDAEIAECNGENVVTMMDVLQEQQDFEEDANAVLGASDDKNCTYSKGYVKRQAIYACLTCCPDAATDPLKRAGVCLACSLACHENHELVELYTKRNFRCDCGNPKFTQPCQFTPNKTDLNYENKYNQNFSGIYCNCKRPYPDPESIEEEEMIQCIVCEDWLHTNHLEATIPNNDQYAEMICKACMEDIDFLHDYSDLVVNVEDKEIIVMDPDLDVSSIIKAKEISKKEDNSSNNIAEVETSKEKDEPVNVNEKEILSADRNDTAADIEMNISEPDKCGDGNEISKEETDKSEQNLQTEASGDANPIVNTVESSKDLETDNIEKNEENNDQEKESSENSAQLNTDAEKNCDEAEKTSIEDKESAETSPNKADSSESINKVEKSEADSATDANDKATDNVSVDDAAKEDCSNATDDVSIDDAAKEVCSNATDDVSIDDAAKEVCSNATDDVSIDDAAKEACSNATDDVSVDDAAKEVCSNATDDVSVDNAAKEDCPNTTSDKENEIPSNNQEHKRKLSEEDIDISPKKKKLESKPCVRPRGVKRVYKGATFWTSTLRQKLCTCTECLAMYKDLAVLFLTDPEDTVSAYEALGKENIEGAPSQYEKGLQALSSLDRVQQINALTEYNKMRDKLLDFLKSFKDRKEIVKEEDIKAFFAGMKPKREPDGVYFCR